MSRQAYAAAWMSDFFESHVGNARDYMRRPRLARLLDALHDRALPRASLEQLAEAEARLPPERVLVVGVSVPGRENALQSITSQLAHSRHDVHVSTVPMLPQGKFENVDDAIRAAPLPIGAYDWLVITDDDITLGDDYLDRYLAIARAADFSISQPAHKFLSYTTYQLTRRRWRSLARRTCFVEIGPFTVFRANTFAALVPFPPSRWSYGLDVLWASQAIQHGWNIGIVDGLPVSHTRSVGGSYNMEGAREEGRQLLSRSDVVLNRADLFGPGTRLL